MQFGICTTVENSALVKAAGWGFVEERVDLLIQGLVPDSDWIGAQRAAKSVLPVPAANVLVPPVVKITGPNANIEQLRSYMTTVLDRCVQIGIKTLVFGSGGARKVPEGFDQGQARKQIIEFLRLIAPMLQQRGILLVVEHLNAGETNIILSVEEAMTYVRELDHPNVKCLLDTYHFWLSKERMDSIAPALPWIKHVHVSDVDRHPPKNGDYRSIFAILKEGGYSGPISVEAIHFDIERDGPRVLAFLKEQWNKA